MTSYIFCSVFLWFLWAYSLANAQGPPMTPSGLNTQVSGPVVINSGPTQVTQYNITGGTRAGANLFHSFGNFDVPERHIANFSNDAGLVTSNILGRVTGGNISNISGTIQTSGFANANLFLMNPSGIVFGPTASLNVGGSVTFTTADYLRLADNGRFTAIPNTTTDALLSTAPVVAYGFLGSNTRAITVQGSQLAVEESQSISLIGGNITIKSGRLAADQSPSPQRTSSVSRINLASVASTGEVLAETLNFAPNINAQPMATLGTVEVLEGSVIDVSGKGGGTVLIRGGQFVLENATISANVTGPGHVVNGVETIGTGINIIMSRDIVTKPGALLETNVSGHATPNVQYGGINIRADQIDIIGSPDFDFDNGPFTEIISDVASEGKGGNSGSIKLEANTILVKDFVRVRTSTSGYGNGGNIILRSGGNLELNGPILETESIKPYLTYTGDLGNAGNIELTSAQGDILLPNAPSISSLSSGRGTVGSIELTAKTGDIHLNNVGEVSGAIFTKILETKETSDRGGIQLTAKNLRLENSGIQIDNFTSSQPGALEVDLTGLLHMRGDFAFPSTTTLLTTTRGQARSADLNITAHDILLTGKSLLSTETYRNGDGGTLNIFSNSLELARGAQITSSSRFNPDTSSPPETPSGTGGSITVRGQVDVADSVLIHGQRTEVHNGETISIPSGILSNTEGTGTAGHIVLDAKTFSVQNGGTLSAATSGTDRSATGGSITVAASDQINLNNGASITASTSGPGNAGNVWVGANDISISGGSTITASSTGSGNAGTVTVQGLQSPVSSFLIDGSNSGVFTKTTNAGTGGNLSVSSNSIVIQNKGTVSGETSGTGSGGNIALTAGQSVTIKDGAAVSSSSIGPGVAGNIEINAGKQLDVERGSITTQSNQLNGGNINIQAIDLVRVVDGKVSTSVLGGAGSGGNITIDPKVVLLQNSDILAQANRGTGGDISITTPVFIADESSRVDASTPFGLNGRITIQSPTSNLSGTVGQLVSKTSPLQVLLQNRCVALAGGEQSTFLLAGRDALPGEPSGWLSSPISMEHWTGEDTAHASRLMARNQNVDSSLVIAAHSDKSRVLSLRRLTPPGFLVRTFATGATGCPS